MTSRGRFTCLLAILTVMGGTMFGVTGALGRGDAAHHGSGAIPISIGGHGQADTAVFTGAGGGAPPYTANGPLLGGQGNPVHVGGSGDGYDNPTPKVGGPVIGPTNPGPGSTPTADGPIKGPINGGPADGHGGDAGHGHGPLMPPSSPGDGAAGSGGPLNVHPIVVGPVGPTPTYAPLPPTAPHGPGDGHDRGTHHSQHGVCSGVCHTGNDQPNSSIPVPTTPPQPVTTTTTPTPPSGTTKSPTHHTPSVFQVTAGAPITVHTGNPVAANASLGSVAATGANASASAGGLGLLAPATAAVGVHRGSAHGSGTGGGRGSGAASSPFAGPTGTHLLDFSGAGPAAILQIVGVVPTVVWIAIGALILLAAVTGGIAILKGRHAARSDRQLERVQAVAKTDALTGVLNRRGFTEAVERELARARRHSRPFVLAYVDVRGLKAVNDTEGHLAGDELLKGVAMLLTESARADDVVGRIGGDELGVLLVEQSGDSAAAVTSRIRSQVSARRESMGLRTPWGLTVGTAAFPEDGGTFDELVAAADRRLYEQRGIALADGRV